MKGFDFKAHFRMLRLAKLRGLAAAKTGDRTYSVPSHSRPGLLHAVDLRATRCTCEAKLYCTHIATALHEWVNSEADTITYLGYRDAELSDFYSRRVEAATAHNAKLHAESAARDKMMRDPKAIKRLPLPPGYRCPFDSLTEVRAS